VADLPDPALPPRALVELPEPPEPSRATVRAALDRAADGVLAGDPDQPDVLADATALLAARGEDLDALLELAAARRDAHLAGEGRPGLVTYSPKVFVPLTRLCRDRCHYCTFATVPGRLPAAYLGRDEVLAIAREGAAQGCTEVLFTLGDRPEDRWAAARDWLAAHDLRTTLDHVEASAQAVLTETGLLPHLNPGVMDLVELQRLRAVSPSMGMMLETTATRLWSRPGGAHFGSPDKEPALRRRVVDDAGRARVPFTTGILVGIGEHRAERAQSLLELAASARRGGHVQEVIVQNFRAKPDTAMRGEPDAEFDAFVAAVAVARLIMPLGVSVQAPPNLAGELDDSGDEAERSSTIDASSAAQDQALLLRAGIDDWGGVSPVTPDHVNPERPWPGLDALRTVTSAAGFTLTPRLTIYPRYVQHPDRWLHPDLVDPVIALADQRGLARVRQPAGV
jgi:7,8-didemethyl-8-hydroxy-5-deazariboflavin synthase CofG subunit